MTPLYDNQEFYKKMLELQERLRKSEDERMKLEERFNLLSQDSRIRRETCINNLRMRYIDFLEEQRLRDERNHQILGSLDKIDGSLARMTARTDRLGILRKQYEAYLLRVYANRNTGDGTGDSGVGSHNELHRSSKANILQIDKNLPQMQSVGNPPPFIPQTNYPQSYITPSNISQFNVPRYTSGQENPRVNVMQTHGQGDDSTIVQPHQYIPELFYGSQNLNTPNISLPKTQLMPEVTQQLAASDQFSNHQLPTNYPQVQHLQGLRDTSNQYLANPRPAYASDPSMMRSRNFPDSRDIISSNLQSSPGLQSERANRTDAAMFLADSTDEAFGPYRHSTPLPGYLDYSTRYSRDSTVHDSNAPLRYGFTRSDLEKVINRNEPILPKDYLHNPETVKPAMHTSKLSSLIENKQKASDTQPSRGLNDDELDQYINRIRSLHRDNDQSLEALDIEQNTSGDLLNATLSDDGTEQLELHSDDKIKPNETKILADDLKNVFALADDFVAETRHSGNEFQVKSDFSNGRKIPSESVLGPGICNENIIAKSKFAESNDARPVILKADTMSDNLSNSTTTRDDMLSGRPSVGENRIKDTSATADGKFSHKITPPITDLDTSRVNITDVATLSGNKLVHPKKLAPNEREDNQLVSNTSKEYMKILEEKFHPEEKIISQIRTPIEVPSSCNQPEIKDHGFVSKVIEDHEDIEGDKVKLIEGEQIPDQVIDVIRELEPPSLQHYEKNVVEIHEGNEDKKDVETRLADNVSESKIQGNEDSGVNAVGNLPQDLIANKIHAESDLSDQKNSEAEKIEEQIFDSSKEEINTDVQYQHDAEPNFNADSGREYPGYENQPEQNLTQDRDQNRDASERFEQNSEQIYDPIATEQLGYDTRQTNDESNQLNKPYVPASDEPYDSNQMYDPNQEYETDLNQQNAQESNEQFAYDSNQHFEDDPNKKYTADPNEQYAIHPNEQYPTGSNEQYTTDPNEQFAADPNEQYPTDPNQEYTGDPNEQYGYYQDQPYQNDPNAGYENSGNEQYDYSANQGYEHDPNQQYEHDPNQQYEHDPNQQYEHDPNQQYEQDPNQQYEHDPNESSVQDVNHEYREEEYGKNEIGETVGYDESEQGGNNQQFENDSQQNYTDHNLELKSSNQDYPTAPAVDENESQAMTGALYNQELSNPDDIGTTEYTGDGKKKNKDVIRALLESDTESTIERNPSNNTESDFDFN